MGLNLASHIGREPEMPIWPMPRSYSHGEETVFVDSYHFRFIPNEDHPDILAAIDRYKKQLFGDNIAAPARAEALCDVRIDVKDYSVQLNVGS